MVLKKCGTRMESFCCNCQLFALPESGLIQFNACIEQVFEFHENLFLLFMFKGTISEVTSLIVCLTLFCHKTPLDVTTTPYWYLSFLKSLLFPT